MLALTQFESEFFCRSHLRTITWDGKHRGKERMTQARTRDCAHDMLNKNHMDAWEWEPGPLARP